MAQPQEQKGVEFTHEHPEYTHNPHQPSEELLRAAKFAPKGDILTFGATPLDRIATLLQQNDAQDVLAKLFRAIPDGTPMAIASYLGDTFVTRFTGRSEANNDNFVDSFVPVSDITLFPPSSFEMIERAQLGHASPAELLIVRDLLGIRSVELACLTHPYGEQIDPLLDKMRSAVRYSVRDIMHGEWFDAPKTRFRIKESVNEFGLIQREEDSGAPAGILMTRKRTLAKMQDGTFVRERSSFVLRTDSQGVLYSLLGPEMLAELAAIRHLPGEAQEEALARFTNAIEPLLNDDLYDQAIPISTTIYAYNANTATLLEATATARRAERDAYFEAHNVDISDEAFEAKKEFITRQGYLDGVSKNSQKFASYIELQDNPNLSLARRRLLEELSGHVGASSKKGTRLRQAIARLFKSN